MDASKAENLSLLSCVTDGPRNVAADALRPCLLMSKSVNEETPNSEPLHRPTLQSFKSPASDHASMA